MSMRIPAMCSKLKKIKEKPAGANEFKDGSGRHDQAQVEMSGFYLVSATSSRPPTSLPEVI